MTFNVKKAGTLLIYSITGLWLGYLTFKAIVPILTRPFWTYEYKKWHRNYVSYKRCSGPFYKTIYKLLGDELIPIGEEMRESVEFNKKIDKALEGSETCGDIIEPPLRIYIWD